MKITRSHHHAAWFFMYNLQTLKKRKTKGWKSTLLKVM